MYYIYIYLVYIPGRLTSAGPKHYIHTNIIPDVCLHHCEPSRMHMDNECYGHNTHSTWCIHNVILHLDPVLKWPPITRRSYR